MLIIRLTPVQAAALIREVGLCEIVGPDEIPTPAPGREVNLICAFVFGENIFWYLTLKPEQQMNLF
ncbi:hypothetical protein JTT01_13520 [Clostridium botulinum]|nr:hypothetical protein [Clostridium botulinum]